MPTRIRSSPASRAATFTPGHVLPAEFEGDADRYIDVIAEDWLLRVDGRAAMVDVRVDDGAFSAAQGRRLLTRARDLGFEITAHANEMGYGQGVRMAAELNAA